MFSDYIRWPAFVGLIVLSGLTMLVHFTGPSHDWSEYANNLVTFVELEFCAFLVVGALSQLHNDPSPVWHGIGVVFTVLLYCLCLVPWGLIWWAGRKFVNRHRETPIHS
jgi:hypothetical protein